MSQVIIRSVETPKVSVVLAENGVLSIKVEQGDQKIYLDLTMDSARELGSLFLSASEMVLASENLGG